MRSLLVALACVSANNPELDPVAEQSEAAETDHLFAIEVGLSEHVPTVVTASWSSSSEGEGWVEYTVDGVTRSTPIQKDRNHQHTLIGLPPTTDVTLQLHTSLDTFDRYSGEIVISTGLLPDLPDLEATSYSDELGDAWLLAVVMDPDSSQVVMFDRSGEIVWALPETEAGVVGMDVQLFEQEIDFNLFSTDHSQDVGRIERVTLAGAPLDPVQTPGGHHTFARLPDGAIAYAAIDVREDPTHGDVVGDALVEIGPDGAATELLSTWDLAEPAPGQTWETGFYPQGWDWTHANSVTWSEPRQSYLLSLAGTNQILEVDRAGALLRTFGGATAQTSDYAIDPPESAFSLQHGTHFTEDGDLLMLSFFGDHSRALRFAIDEENATLNETWSHGEDGAVLAVSLGGVQEAPGGDLLVNWGAAGLLQQVTDRGEVVWEASLGVGSFFGEVQILESPYGP